MRVGMLVLAALVAAAGAAAAVLAAEPAKSDVSVRKVNEQVVLYTVYRGDYSGVGQTIGRLIGTAVQKGAPPAGPITFVYLNNPQFVSKEHYLTEIRIPVGADALKLAGTLGEFTDVKKLPAMEVAVIHKPVGQDNVPALRGALMRWMRENGYEAAEAFGETFLSQGGASYADMETEIFLPVQRAAAQP
jgi:effector-binding domain-containing protein